MMHGASSSARLFAGRFGLTSRCLIVLLCLPRRVVAEASSSCIAGQYADFEDEVTTYKLTDDCALLYTCPAGFYCPGGVYEAASAEEALEFFEDAWPFAADATVLLGFNANTFAYSIPCKPGFYCSENTVLPRYCPAGYYCRRPSTRKKCLEGQYCKEGSTSGSHCPFFSDCPEGTKEPNGEGQTIISFFIMTVFAYFAWKLFDDVQQSRLNSANRDLEEYIEVLENPADDDYDDEDAATGKMVEESIRNLASAFDDDVDGEFDRDERRRHGRRRRQYLNRGEENGGDIFFPAASCAPKEDVKVVMEEEDEVFDEFVIEFENVELVLKNGVKVVRGVTGVLTPGRSTAIMGASGAGKTTLMNLITGKVTRTAGVVRVNGEECSCLERWKSRVAFVPQEDVMHRSLTVLQNIEFAAHMRLPTIWSHAKVQQKIYRTLVSLNLDQVRHSVIGDEYERGVSGGQRKRVNVAIEVVADPKVLFLDEPTSGLDSASATELAATLSVIARKGRMTVTAVIHSPGPMAFAAFDDLILLQTGGRPIYLGPVASLESYLGSIGFRRMANEPLADYMMLAAAGRIQPTGLNGGKWDHLTGFHRLWHLHMKLPEPKQDDDEALVVLKRVSGASRCQSLAWTLAEVLRNYLCDYPLQVLRQCCPVPTNPERPSPGSVEQFLLCLRRASRQQYASLRNLFFGGIFVQFIIGVFMAALVGENLNVLGGYAEDVCARGHPQLAGACLDLQANSYIQVMPFVSFIVVSSASALGSNTFGREMAIYWRESSTNLHTPSYFLAKVVSDVPQCLAAAAACFSGFQAAFVSPMPNEQLLAGFVLLYVFGFLSGYFISFTVPYPSCGLAGVGWAVFWTLLYSGTGRAMSDCDEASERWIWAISLPRWVNEAFFDATTVKPFAEVPNGPLKGDALFDLSRQKQTYLFFHTYSEAMANGLLVCFVLLVVDLILITSTKLDKKR